ncbi:MAG: ATP-binding cassette domain-containing protein, partial [Thermofilum sp.]
MREKLVYLRDVSYRYPDSETQTLKNINFDGYRDEIILLIGPSGCGKSTLARIFNGLIPNFYGGQLQGEIDIAGYDPRKTPTAKFAKTVGFVFQNPENQLFVLRAWAFRHSFTFLEFVDFESGRSVEKRDEYRKMLKSIDQTDGIAVVAV